MIGCSAQRDGKIEFFERWQQAVEQRGILDCELPRERYYGANATGFKGYSSYLVGMSEDVPSRSRGDLYALSALRNRRAEIASQIVECERKLRHYRESLVHVDACLKLLDPDADPDAIPNKRLPRRVKLFGQGQLGRMILDALRDAGGAASAREIVTAIMAVGEHDEAARRTVAPRVRGNLAYLVRRGTVSKEVGEKGVIWRIAQ